MKRNTRTEVDKINIDNGTVLGQTKVLKTSEEKISHLNRVLKSVKNVNQLITKEKNRYKLLEGVCRNLIENHAYDHAWVALIDESKNSVIIKDAGRIQDFIRFEENLKKNEWPNCIRETLKSSEISIIEDRNTPCEICPIKHSSPSTVCMAIRMEYEEKVFGLLSVSIGRKFAQDSEERALFNEVADDIAFALRSIELEEERQHIEKALQESEQKYRQMFELTPVGIGITTLKGEIRDFNRNLIDMLGLTHEEYRTTDINNMYADFKDREKILSTLKEKGQVRNFEVKLRRKDGIIFLV